MDPNQFANQLYKDFHKSFPNGWIHTQHGKGGGLYIRFALLPPGKQPNGIIQNDPSYNTFWIHGGTYGPGAYRPRGDVHAPGSDELASELQVEISEGGRLRGSNGSKLQKTGWRNGSGSADALLKKFDAHFKKLRAMVDARDDIVLDDGRKANPSRSTLRRREKKEDDEILASAGGTLVGFRIEDRGPSHPRHGTGLYRLLAPNRHKKRYYLASLESPASKTWIDDQRAEDWLARDDVKRVPNENPSSTRARKTRVLR